MIGAHHRKRHRHAAVAARERARQRSGFALRSTPRHYGHVGSSPLLLLALVLIYGFTIPSDSGALASGTTASATPAYRGATLALHSTVGFGLSALGGWGAGIALDAAGGPGQPAAWSALFALLAAGVLFGPIALRWSRQGRVIAS